MNMKLNKIASGSFLKLFSLLIPVIFFKNADAQTEWQNWNGITVSGPLTDKLSAKIGHTRAYSLSNKYENTFNQNQFQFSYELNNKWDIQSGVQLITPDSSKDTRTRVYLRAAHITRISRKVNWTNSLRIETNSKNENRFRQRIKISSRLGLRKRLNVLNLAPSITYSLFYNIGGGPLRYYDENAQLVARQSPDGFHRSRLTINLNSKLTKYLSVSLYYMRQQEFNFLSAETRKINITDPVRNRVLRPFNNYNTLGITAQLNLEPFIKK
jgi:hypothetical protein